MADAIAIEDRVAGNAHRRRAGQQRVAPAPRPADTAHSDDAEGDGDDARRLDAGDRPAGAQRGDQGDDERRTAAGERVDEAQLALGVGRREQGEVGELERRRGHEVRDRLGLDTPDGEAQRRPDHDRGQQLGRRGHAGVVGAREEQVPDGVDRRRAERERQRVGGHV